MARSRIPTAKALVSGADLRNPARFRGRQAPARPRPLGEPFARMTPGQADAWREFQSELPWLTSSHRALVQVASVLRSRIDSDPAIGITALSAYSAILSKLAATPIDDSKVSAPDDAEDDETARFFN